MDKKKILLVDDIRLFLEEESSLFNGDDYEILLASNGVEALKIIRSADPDMVFMDLYMPGMEGDKCCQFIKSDETIRHIPVIMVTQGANDDDFERCWRAGCDDIIPKPINRNYFLAIAKKHLHILSKTAPRYAARLNVQYHCSETPDRLLSNYSVNLSTDGIFIETADLLPIDSRLNIEFNLPEMNRTINCVGRVAWLNHPEAIKNPNLPVGMGLQFITISPDEMDAIRQYIKDQALEPHW